MGEVKRYEPQVVDAPTGYGWGVGVTMVEMPGTSSAPGWYARADYARLEREHAAAQAELTRLRAVEANAQMTRNRLEAVERAVAAVSEAMMMRATRWKETQSAQWAGDALALFAVSLAEACGRKGND